MIHTPQTMKKKWNNLSIEDRFLHFQVQKKTCIFYGQSRDITPEFKLSLMVPGLVYKFASGELTLSSGNHMRDILKDVQT